MISKFLLLSYIPYKILFLVYLLTFNKDTYYSKKKKLFLNLKLKSFFIVKVFALNVVIACLVLVASSSGNAEAAAKGPKVRKLIHYSTV